MEVGRTSPGPVAAVPGSRRQKKCGNEGTGIQDNSFLVITDGEGAVRYSIPEEFC